MDIEFRCSDNYNLRYPEFNQMSKVSQFMELPFCFWTLDSDRRYVMNPNNNFTAQEKAVLSLLVQGKRNSSIAEAVYLSKRTVDNHLYRIFAKLGVSSRIEAVLYVLETGLLSSSE